jgi:hypothetical protein
MGKIGGSALSNGPFLRHQQTSVSRRHVEDLIDLMTAQVNPIDGFGELPNQSHSHVFGWKASWIPKMHRA